MAANAKAKAHYSFQPREGGVSWRLTAIGRFDRNNGDGMFGGFSLPLHRSQESRLMRRVRQPDNPKLPVNM